MKEVVIKVDFGNIARKKSDALITAINSAGAWFGGIDGVIQKEAGSLFHSQVALKMPIKDGQTIVAISNGHAHSGAFANVIFVVDDLKRPLREIVNKGLDAAAKAGFKSVTLPTIRMGVMIGIIEPTPEAATKEMALGVSSFLENNPQTSIKEVTFVVYNDQQLQNMLKRSLREFVYVTP